MRRLVAALFGAAVTVWSYPATSGMIDYAVHDPAAPQRLSHDNFSRLLARVVLDVGISDREKPETRRASAGTRMKQGSTSNFRFEGNRVMFHLFTANTRASITAYRTSLEQAVRKIGFANFNRNEQLAILLNLHNALVLEAIAERYPVTSLQDAGFRNEPRAQLGDATASADDIRAIVYANWNDPIVIYGLWEGTIGGPSLLTTAYDAEKVWRLLDASAREFTTSRRGFERYGKQLSVSILYDKARKFFPQFERDIVAHLRHYAHATAQEELAGEVVSVSPRAYDWMVADLFSGDQSPPDLPGALEGLIIDDLGLRDNREFSGELRLNGSARALIGKVYEYRRRTGRVTIEDIETSDPDEQGDDTAPTSYNQPE